MQFPTDSFIQLFPTTPKVFHKLGKFYNRLDFTDDSWIRSLIAKQENEDYILLDINYLKIFKDFLSSSNQSADAKTYIRNVTRTHFLEKQENLTHLYQNILLKGVFSNKIVDAKKVYVMMPFEAPDADFYTRYIDLGE